MTVPDWPPADPGDTPPSIARINDYWLSGTHNTEQDRALAQEIVLCAPHIPYLVRELRDLLSRMVLYLMNRGIRQFLDLGSGIPAVGHVHEVAHNVDPATRVVYVDHDADVATQGRKIVAGLDTVEYAHADIRRPDELLAAPEVRDTLDLTSPVAVLIIEALLDVPDEDDPGSLIAAYRDRLSKGSYLGITHFSDQDEQLRTGLGLFSRMFELPPPPVTLRSRDEVERLFGGMTVVDPGVVPVPLWHTDPGQYLGPNPENVPIHVGLGRID